MAATEWTCPECGKAMASTRAGMHTMHHRKASKAKERAQGNDAAVTATPAPLPPIPTAAPGFQVVFNRLPRKYDKMFGGVPYDFGPHDYRVVTNETAEFLEATSIIRYDPATQEVTRALVRQGHPMFGKRLPQEEYVEMLDRKTEDNYIGRGTGGLKTRATVVAVSGGNVEPGQRER